MAHGAHRQRVGADDRLAERLHMYWNSTVKQGDSLMSKNLVAGLLALSLTSLVSANGKECKDARAKNTEQQELYSCIEFKTPVALPAIPNYPGKATMLAGLVYPNVKGGPTYSMRFATHEEGDQVMGFYRQVFAGQPWSTDQTASQGKTVAAFDRNGNICQVTVFSSYKDSAKQWHTEFLIQYKERRSPRSSN